MTTVAVPQTQDSAQGAMAPLLPSCNQVLTRVGALAVRDTGPTDPPGLVAFDPR